MFVHQRWPSQISTMKTWWTGSLRTSDFCIIIGRTSRLRLGVSAKALAKFWRLIGFRKYFFLFTIRKRRSVAFQPCITLGGVHWVGMGQNNDFLQKSGLKTLILAVMVLDQLTLEWAGTHNFKDIPNFHRCFKKSGTSVSKWAMGKSSNFNIVRMKILWIFFRCGHGKKLKTAFFHKTLIPRNLLKEKNIQDRTMWKRTSWRFQKCGTYWACQLLNGSYCCSKSKDCEILAPLAKIRSRKKKTTAVIFNFERCHWISVEPTMMGPRWFNGNAQNWKLRPWFFFLRLLVQSIFSWNLTKLWHPITMV